MENVTYTSNGIKYYQTGRVAKIIGCTPAYINALIAKGKLKAVKEPANNRMGYIYLVPSDEVDHYLGTRKTKRTKNAPTDISNEETVEEVPMTKEEIKERLPEDVKDRLPDLEEFKRDILVHMEMSLAKGVAGLHAHNIKLLESNRNTVDILAENAKELNNLREEVGKIIEASVKFEDLYHEAFMRGYEQGFKDGSYVKSEYKTKSMAERYSGPNVSYTGRFGGKDE